MLGAFVIGFLSDGLVIIGVSSYWQTVFTGAVIVLAVLLNSHPVRRPAQAVLTPPATRVSPHAASAADRPSTESNRRTTGSNRPTERTPCSKTANAPPARRRRSRTAARQRSAWADGLISIIVNDPANPYWLTEGNVAKATAEKLGYTANVGAHKGDTNTESTLIDTAITNKSVAIILDPANADGSVGAVKKAVDAGIPVFLVNAEINQEGLAKAQLVSNNAQGAAIGAQQWVEAHGRQGQLRRALRQPRPTTTPPPARTATRPC